MLMTHLYLARLYTIARWFRYSRHIGKTLGLLEGQLRLAAGCRLGGLRPAGDGGDAQVERLGSTRRSTAVATGGGLKGALSGAGPPRLAQRTPGRSTQPDGGWAP